MNFLILHIQLRKFKDSDKDNENRFVINNSEVISTIINDLPYKLTNAQLRTWNEIEKICLVLK